MPDAQRKSIQVTDAMADLIGALEEMLEHQVGQPSAPVVRLTEAAYRLASRWADYQEALDPAGWAATKAQMRAQAGAGAQPTK